MTEGEKATQEATQTPQAYYNKRMLVDLGDYIRFRRDSHNVVLRNKKYLHNRDGYYNSYFSNVEDALRVYLIRLWEKNLKDRGEVCDSLNKAFLELEKSKKQLKKLVPNIKFEEG